VIIIAPTEKERERQRAQTMERRVGRRASWKIVAEEAAKGGQEAAKSES